jgi:hypothetical protein
LYHVFKKIDVNYLWLPGNCAKKSPKSGNYCTAQLLLSCPVFVIPMFQIWQVFFRKFLVALNRNSKNSISGSGLGFRKNGFTMKVLPNL